MLFQLLFHEEFLLPIHTNPHSFSRLWLIVCRYRSLIRKQWNSLAGWHLLGC